MVAWSSSDGYAVAALVVVAYAAIVALLYRAGRIGPDKPLSLFYGVALMLKTQRGNALLERVGRFRRLWSVLGDIGLVLAGIAMVGIVLVLVIEAFIVLRVPASAAPSASEALGIPGLNPIIPLGYGVVALVVGIVLHELMHGVLARSQKIGVRSVGILWLVIPIGAFVEQDELEMLGAKRRQRGRVAAAGILANFGLALVFFLALSGLVASSVVPNANGVGVAYVLPGFPASNASLAAGDIITSVNGTPVTTTAELLNALGNTTANESIAVDFYSAAQSRSVTAQITLTSAASYDHVRSDASKGFLGVSVTLLTPAELQGELANPYTSAFGPVGGPIYWVVLPIAGLEPVQGTTMSFFHLTGPATILGTTGFWISANLLFWLAWMNLLLGLSNALPIVPLDGGLLFRDAAGAIARRLRRGWDEARIELFSGRAVAASTAIVIFLLLWQFLAHYL